MDLAVFEAMSNQCFVAKWCEVDQGGSCFCEELGGSLSYHPHCAFYIGRNVVRPLIDGICVLPRVGYTCLCKVASLFQSLLPSFQSHSQKATEAETRALRSCQDSELLNERRISRFPTRQIYGELPSGAKPLYSRYWKEAIPLELEIDGKKYLGHFPIKLFKRFHMWEEWSSECDETGTPYRVKYTVQEYMNKIMIPRLDPKEKAALLARVSKIIEYYSRKELETLETHFSARGELFTRTPYFNRWLDFANGTKETYRTYLSQFQKTTFEAKDFYVKGRSLSLTFVLMPNGKFFIQVENDSFNTHCSLTNGAPVLAAGELTINQEGMITEVRGLSGHYRPGITQMISLLEFLRDNHVDINDLTIAFRTNDTERETTHIQKGGVIQWMEQERLKADRQTECSSTNNSAEYVLPRLRTANLFF